MKFGNYFKHRSKGFLHFDPKKGTKHFDPWWAIIICDGEIINLYQWMLKSKGIFIEKNKLWGPHISVIKGEKPLCEEHWGEKENKEIEFWYTNKIRFDNKKHAWLDCICPEMIDIRKSFGFTGRLFYHMTIGKLR